MGGAVEGCGINTSGVSGTVGQARKNFEKPVDYDEWKNAAEAWDKNFGDKKDPPRGAVV